MEIAIEFETAKGLGESGENQQPTNYFRFLLQLQSYGNRMLVFANEQSQCLRLAVQPRNNDSTPRHGAYTCNSRSIVVLRLCELAAQPSPRHVGIGGVNARALGIGPVAAWRPIDARAKQLH